MKQSKLEAYRLYFLTLCCWNLVIRFDGKEELIVPELKRIKLDIETSITSLPRSCPTLKYMQEQIQKSRWINKL